MDLNYVLLWFTAVSGVFGLIRVLRMPSRAKSGWIKVFLLLLLLVGTGSVLFPQYAGIAGFVFWSTFVLAPSLLYRRVQNDLFRQKFSRARKLAQWTRLLHPTDGFREYPDLLRAFELVQMGKEEEAERVLERYKSHPGWIGEAAQMFEMRLNNDWNGIVGVSGRLGESSLGRSPDILTTYLRGLGETGRPGEMVDVFGKHRKAVHVYPKNLRDLARLYVYSFTGRTETVRELFRGTLHLYPQDTQEFWIATAELAAGMLPQGRARLESLLPTADGLTRKGLESRLHAELPVAPLVLVPPQKAVLDEEEVILKQEERYDDSARRTHRPLATYALVLMNVLTFVLEILVGGSTDLDTLFRMGAVWPSEVLAGGWWRLIAAQFLHYGGVHLAMNMLGLYVLGAFVDRHLGRLRYLLLYLISGAGAMLTIVLLARMGYMGEDLVVGASGSIFGLVGVTAAILLRGWKSEGSLAARRRLLPIVLVIALQAVFDLLTPQVSFIAHLSGAIYGFILGLIVKGNHQDTKTLRPQN